jgi:hypothetical protein
MSRGCAERHANREAFGNVVQGDREDQEEVPFPACFHAFRLRDRTAAMQMGQHFVHRPKKQSAQEKADGGRPPDGHRPGFRYLDRRCQQ